MSFQPVAALLLAFSLLAPAARAAQVAGPVEFSAPGGVLVPAVTADQMRLVDKIAVEQTGPTLLQMMENAGRSLADLAARTAQVPLESAHVVVLAGPGGNGGGGLAAALHLADRGARVTVVHAAPERLTEAAAQQRALLLSAGGREASPADLAGLRPDLVLDALLGYSAHGAPRGAFRELIDWANAQQAPVVALDLPSGLDATTGEAPGAVVRADATLTLALPKTGLASGHGGALYLADLGIPRETWRRAGLEHRSPFATGAVVPLSRRTP